MIPDSVTKIGERAFSGCVDLKAVEIGNSVTNILYSAFDNCTSLQDVYYNGTEASWSYVDIGDKNQPLLYANLHMGKMPVFVPDTDTTIPSTESSEPTLAPSTEPEPVPSPSGSQESSTLTTEPTAPQENPALSPIAGADIMVDETDKTVIIDVGTDFALFVSQVNNANITLLQANSQPLSAGMLIGTGCSVQVLNEGGIALSTYEIIVPMDVGGDGRITSSDARTALRAAVSLESIQGIYSKAADANGDGRVTSADARAILRCAVGLN